MAKSDDTVFLLDVDNTLLDNDRFGADLDERLTALFGAREKDRYRALFETLREELSYADYLGALQRFRGGLDGDPNLLQMSSFLLDYPFAERLYPGALDAVAYLRTIGLPVILSDGDIVFQPRKIQRSGLWKAVEGRVLVDVHKERALDAMRRIYPAKHYVMIDDKPRILATMKVALGESLTTVFVRQGHYAAESAHVRLDRHPDIEIARIADVLALHESDFLAARATDSCSAFAQEKTR
jgi:FMN phosphatase YigB (HAD superfamily)